MTGIEYIAAAEWSAVGAVVTGVVVWAVARHAIPGVARRWSAQTAAVAARVALLAAAPLAPKPVAVTLPRRRHARRHFRRAA